jgi:hypothetical protein
LAPGYLPSAGIRSTIAQERRRSDAQAALLLTFGPGCGIFFSSEISKKQKLANILIT